MLNKYDRVNIPYIYTYINREKGKKNRDGGGKIGAGG